MTTETDGLLGRLIGPVQVGPPAHGGHCVARYEGRVIFVRHALPGEQVWIRITDTTHDRYWRGDAIEVITPAVGRVVAPCAVSGPGGCGGCDLQHADLATQRALKRQVIAEQLSRLAGIDFDGEVEDCGPVDGRAWRSRMRYLVEDGRVGLRAHRSNLLVELPADGCRIAVASIAQPPQPAAEVETLLGVAATDRTVWADADRPSGQVEQQSLGRTFAVDVDGFWQAHPAAPDLLAEVVLEGLRPIPGETGFDLYCGVGLFAAALLERGCAEVIGVEGSKPAVESARRNLSDFGRSVRFVAGSVERVLRRPVRPAGLPEAVDLIVLDPPRAGAGKVVAGEIARRRPRAVAYVACDPAALARDLATFARRGYHPSSIRAFDLFPMTHHVECVAILKPA